MTNDIPPWPAGVDEDNVRACTCKYCDVLEAVYLDGEWGVVPDVRSDVQRGLEDFAQ